MLKALKEDYKRYYNYLFHRFEWNEPSYIVVTLYRISRGIRMMPKWLFPIKLLLNILIVPLYAFFSIFLGISIPRGAEIGPGLRIYHFGTIVINPCAIIGKNFSIHHGCTIGVKNSYYDQVIVGDNVTMGVGAKVLGNIKIGNNVTIGANAVVLTDVPDNSVAVGIPAKIFPKKNTEYDITRGPFN